MNPIYENIDVAINRSLKDETYRHSNSCETTNWHIHPEYELVYIKNGNGLLRIGSFTTTYTDGVLLFLGPNILHGDFGNKEFIDNSEVVIQFPKNFVEEKLMVFPEFKKFKKLIKISNKGILFNRETKNELAPIFEQFNANNEVQKLINLLIILDKLSDTIHFKTILAEHHIVTHKVTDVKRLETIFQYINEHYKEHIRIEILAKEIGLTKNSFCRFFKKMTHKTFVQFLNEFRIRKAVDLFNTNTTSVAEVMYSCGFNDPSYFTKQFRKHQKVTPSIFLRQCI